jgi:hypothetical protein
MALARRYLSKAHPHIATNYFVLVEILTSCGLGAQRAAPLQDPAKDYLEYNSTISCSLNAGV